MTGPLQDSLSLTVRQSVPPWPDGAVRDTIAAIAKQAAYQRDLGQSVLDRILRWLSDMIEQVMQSMIATPYGRELTIAALVLVVLLIVARVIVGVRAEQKAQRIVARFQTTGGHTVSLAEAERLAAAGDFTGAAHVLFSSLLVVGAARGEFRVHPSKTTGDYVRDLRRKKADWLKPFQSFRSRYDRVIYGDMQCTAADYGALLNDAQHMLTRDRAA